MSMNWVQFWKRMSAPEFLSAFGTKAQWIRAVEQARWPMEFCCPRCIHRDYCMVLSDVRPLFQYSACRQEASLSAGSMFENARLSLTKWFLAI